MPLEGTEPDRAGYAKRAETAPSAGLRADANGGLAQKFTALAFLGNLVPSTNATLHQQFNSSTCSPSWLDLNDPPEHSVCETGTPYTWTCVGENPLAIAGIDGEFSITCLHPAIRTRSGSHQCLSVRVWARPLSPAKMTTFALSLALLSGLD